MARPSWPTSRRDFLVATIASLLTAFVLVPLGWTAVCDQWQEADAARHKSPQELSTRSGQAHPAVHAVEGSRSPPARVDPFGDPLPEGAIARIGTTRLRASAMVNVVAFSHDGRRLAYGNEMGVIHVCEAADGKPLLDFRPVEAR